MPRVNKNGYFPYAWTPKVLPLVYNDSLSYLENVYALIQWCNELSSDIADMNTSLTTMIQQVLKDSEKYTDDKINGFRTEFADLTVQLTEQIESLIQDTERAFDLLEKHLNANLAVFKKEMEERQDKLEISVNEQLSDMRMENAQNQFALEQDISDFETRVNLTIATMRHSITELWTAFNNYRVQVNSYIDFKCEELKGWVESHTALKNGNNIFVFNPVKAETDTLKNTLNDLYNYLDYGSITAQEYAAIGLTAQEYADKGLTAHQYAYEARFMFFKEIYFTEFYKRLDDTIEYVNNAVAEMEKKMYMINPLTGRLERIPKVIDMLADFHLNTLTAQEYSDKDWTAQEYADLDWTAQFYAMSSAGELARVIGNDIYSMSFTDIEKDIVNNIMDGYENLIRGRPIVITVDASDGIATGSGYVTETTGVFLLSNEVDIIRMVYDGNWTTTRI